MNTINKYKTKKKQAQKTKVQAGNTITVSSDQFLLSTEPREDGDTYRINFTPPTVENALLMVGLTEYLIEAAEKEIPDEDTISNSLPDWKSTCYTDNNDIILRYYFNSKAAKASLLCSIRIAQKFYLLFIENNQAIIDERSRNEIEIPSNLKGTIYINPPIGCNNFQKR